MFLRQVSQLEAVSSKKFRLFAEIVGKTTSFAANYECFAIFFAIRS